MIDPDFSAIDIKTMMGEDLWRGFKKGEMAIMSAGRNTGKSTFNIQSLQKILKDMEALDPAYEVLEKATVDGKPWYTISCRKEVSIWVRENGKENVEWFDHIDDKWMYHLNRFDVSQEMFAMIKLRWGT